MNATRKTDLPADRTKCKRNCSTQAIAPGLPAHTKSGQFKVSKPF
jgi:hypothetical protein